MLKPGFYMDSFHQETQSIHVKEGEFHRITILGYFTPKEDTFCIQHLHGLPDTFHSTFVNSSPKTQDQGFALLQPPLKWKFQVDSQDWYVKKFFKNSSENSLEGSRLALKYDEITRFVIFYTKVWQDYFDGKLVTAPTTISILRQHFLTQKDSDDEDLIKHIYSLCYGTDLGVVEAPNHLKALDESLQTLAKRKNSAFQQQKSVQILYGYKALITASFPVNRFSIRSRIQQL